jgi:hypothetical protein
MTAGLLTDAAVLRFPGIVSACLVPGRRRDPHTPTGDAVLVDVSAGVIAVADSPERTPGAARRFLERFHGLVRSGETGPGTGDFHGLVERVNMMVADTGYQECTTFSAFVAADEKSGVILHTGDSLIFMVHGEGGGIRQLSRSNNFLVGRCSELSQAEKVELRPGDVVVLATDGLTNLARCFGLTPDSLLSAEMNSAMPMAAVERIVQLAAGEDASLDDLGMVVAFPDCLAPVSRCPGAESGNA